MAGPDPGWQRAVVLEHHGHGPTHLDILLSNGARCPTLAITGRRWRWQALHRRRYLTCSGPVSGQRGRIHRLWSGPARMHRHNHGWKLVLGTSILLLRGDGVVLLHSPAHSLPWDLRIPA